jgi:hypothetical protein
MAMNDVDIVVGGNPSDAPSERRAKPWLPVQG